MSVPHSKVVKPVIAIDNGQNNSIAAAQRRFREEQRSIHTRQSCLGDSKTV